MVHSTFRRTFVLFVFTLVLGASTALAAPPAGSYSGGWGRAWSWLAEAVGFQKHGCSIDPNGTPRCAPVAPKAGCEISPDGAPRCAPVAPKHGCEINPNGVPRCTG